MDITEQLGVVKKMVHSVLVSSPQVMSLMQLSRDYREMVGADVPYHQLGYKDLEHFLRSLPDIVQVTGSGHMAIVRPVATAESAHIQKFVKCQKKTTRRPIIQSKRRPQPIYDPTPSDLVFINESVGKGYPGNMYYPVNQFRPPMRQPDNNFQQNRPINPFNPQMRVYPIVYLAAHQQGMYNMHTQMQPMRIPYQVKQPLPSPSSTYMPLRSSTPIEMKQPKPTQALDSMVKSFTDLSLAATGEMKAQEKNVSECVCSSNDNKLGPAPVSDLNNDKSPINVMASEEEPVVELGNVESIPLELDNKQEDKSFVYDSSSDDCNESDAFPAYAVDQRVLGVDYPRDTVRSDYKMQRRDLEKDLKVDERYFLQLVEVTNPHSFHFWIYDDYDAYHTFSSNIQEVYKRLDSTIFTMPQCLLTPGHLCVVCPRNSSEWERAKIISQRTDTVRKTIEVELIDTGVIDTVYTKDVKFLMNQFADMPPQAIQGRMAYVSPLKSPRWSSKAVATFKQQVSYCRLFAKVEAIKNNIAHVVLVDGDNVNLNLSLLDSGLVRRCLQS
ncbi:uncharacterized protein LOC117592125 [Drosophila guanche]|uniref:Blast:Tudor domain-containing protein 7B n=1 Tax=Drosophila guanche TaxID=7266 RepID=A0A3B0J504_DROGU|nr:uncharacterized protein LOC117592125 [Drosophila guanche]SPP74652.1 blast:Tudor domain-containing protein 7B [Drosophila guanche]